MELAEELAARNCATDDMTNENFASFDPQFRVERTGEKPEWRILDKLLDYAGGYYEMKSSGGAKTSERVEAGHFGRKTRKRTLVARRATRGGRGIRSTEGGSASELRCGICPPPKKRVRPCARVRVAGLLSLESCGKD